MSVDLEKVRADTPGVGHVVHFNNSGAALMPRPVLDALKHHLDREATIGGYEAESEAEPLIEHSYDAAARLINAGRDEIAIVENATVAWDIAFYGLAQGFTRGDRILTAMAEYASNYIAYLQLQKRTGIVIDVVPNDEFGQLDVGVLEAMIDDRVKLISVTHVPTNGGLVNPAAAIGAVAQRHGIPYLLDACQSVGQMPIDVAAIGCDMLSATGRKYLRGPRGTGFLYVRRSLMDRIEPPFLDLRAATWTEADSFQLRPDARRFENWENYVAGKIGLGVAIDYALDIGLDAIYARIAELATRMRDGLAACDGVTVTDIGREQCGIVTFRHDRHEADSIIDALRQAGINVSASGQSSTLLDMQARGLERIVRAPVHYYNSAQEVDLFLERLGQILGGN